MAESQYGMPADIPDDTREFTAQVLPGQVRFAAPASLSLLESALLDGVSLPSSCRNGTCRACMCRLLAGRVDYRIEWPGLLAEEKRDGFILPCVAHAAGDVVIDAPAATRMTNA